MSHYDMHIIARMAYLKGDPDDLALSIEVCDLLDSMSTIVLKKQAIE